TTAEHHRLRRQALDWLRADLGGYATLAERDPKARAAASARLRDLRQDPDLASVRESAALAKLPEAERASWQKLWAEVGNLLNKLSKCWPLRNADKDGSPRDCTRR